jgi:exodeoxyribonuclease VII large subunit
MAELVHPERPLTKGYVRVTARDGKTLTRASDGREARALTLHFGDGAVDASVDGSGPRAAPPVERKPRRPYIASQPGLFDPAED